MDTFFDESTLADIEQYCNKIQSLNDWDSALVKSDEDDRLVSLVDSPQGSPMSSGPPSPSLPKSDVSALLASPESPTFDALEQQFSFNNSDTMYGIDGFPSVVDEKIAGSILGNDPGTDSLDTWLSHTVSSNKPLIRLTPEDAAALLAGVSPAIQTESSPENVLVESQYAVDEVSSTISTETDYSSDLLTEEELLKLSVKNLNRRLANYPKNIQKVLKQKRRTLKNRGYAQSCRTKRMKNQSGLEQENNQLLNELSCMKKQLGSYKGLYLENETIKAELHLLRSEVINLRQENEILKATRE